jgi:hypothetical protein
LAAAVQVPACRKVIEIKEPARRVAYLSETKCILSFLSTVALSRRLCHDASVLDLAQTAFGRFVHANTKGSNNGGGREPLANSAWRAEKRNEATFLPANFRIAR